MITLIVAYNKNLVIGDDTGNIPWKIPEDLKFFKEYTMGKPCIMGRKTWDSIPSQFKPLKGRTNIIVSRSLNQNNNNFYVKNSIEESIDFAKKICEEICVIGGEQIYKYCFRKNIVDKIVASEINGFLDVKAGAYFPYFQKERWATNLEKVFEKFKVYSYVKK